MENIFFIFCGHKKNDYTRIYHLDSLTVVIHTCEQTCFSCWEGYDKCTDCNNSSYAGLVDDPAECYPPTYPVEGYIYDNLESSFLYCYDSCKFCTVNSYSTSVSDQKCSSCLSGYLYSYVHPGNCYYYADLEISTDKEVDSERNIFISSMCSNYKIASTGECIDACPENTPYYSYEYNETTHKFEQVAFNPPKYKYNNLCYEACPNNFTPDENNVCICSNSFYQDVEGNIVCLPDDNCSDEYPYLNQDSKECSSSLENCNYFAGDICYNNCPNDKVLLSTLDENIINYIKEKLSLDDNLSVKFCTCYITNGVWSNIDSTKDYYQECLSSCPTGYEPEDISKQCVLKNIEATTNIINNPSTNIMQFLSTEIVNNENEISTSLSNINPPPSCLPFLLQLFPLLLLLLLLHHHLNHIKTVWLSTKIDAILNVLKELV